MRGDWLLWFGDFPSVCSRRAKWGHFEGVGTGDAAPAVPAGRVSSSSFSVASAWRTV